MVTRSKGQGGLRVLKLKVHDDALLMKHLHKFYSRADLPWVQLLWDKYYNQGTLPVIRKRGSFLWRDVLKLHDQFKGWVNGKLGDGKVIALWNDMWEGHILKLEYPHLFSFAKNQNITVQEAMQAQPFYQLFHSPLSEQAYHQLGDLLSWMQQLHHSQEVDEWLFM